jgi:hypothetical protein
MDCIVIFGLTVAGHFVGEDEFGGISKFKVGSNLFDNLHTGVFRDGVISTTCVSPTALSYEGNMSKTGTTMTLESPKKKAMKLRRRWLPVGEAFPRERAFYPCILKRVLSGKSKTST